MFDLQFSVLKLQKLQNPGFHQKLYLATGGVFRLPSDAEKIIYYYNICLPLKPEGTEFEKQNS
jgi:hypothetical protein